MSKNKAKENTSCRLGAVGGQAVLEGVMMKSKDLVALSVRGMDGKINTEVTPFKAFVSKHKFLNIPIIRGIINFIEMMLLSFKTLNRSVDMLGIEEEPSKFEKWLEKKFGKSITAIASFIGTILGLGLAILLFMYLPIVISNLTSYIYESAIVKSVVEGVVKIIIFILYIFLCGLIPDMKRVFQYHGAEHKSIFCHEQGLELTPENVKKMKRFHPRCGTSLLFVMMILGIISSLFIVHLPTLPRLALKILFLPLVVGIGYEFIKFAGKHENILTKVLSAPGLWIQRLTTKEPDLSQIEVAICSLKAALPDIYPVEEEQAEVQDTDKAQIESQAEEEQN